jgi:hypothetical protein
MLLAAPNSTTGFYIRCASCLSIERARLPRTSCSNGGCSRRKGDRLAISSRNLEDFAQWTHPVSSDCQVAGDGYPSPAL